MRLARHAREMVREDIEVAYGGPAADDLMRNAKTKRCCARHSLRSIPDRRAVLVAHDFDGTTGPEIADALSIPLKTIIPPPHRTRAIHRRGSARPGKAEGPMSTSHNAFLPPDLRKLIEADRQAADPSEAVRQDVARRVDRALGLGGAMLIPLPGIASQQMELAGRSRGGPGCGRDCRVEDCGRRGGGGAGRRRWFYARCTAGKRPGDSRPVDDGRRWQRRTPSGARGQRCGRDVDRQQHASSVSLDIDAPIVSPLRSTRAEGRAASATNRARTSRARYGSSF